MAERPTESLLDELTGALTPVTPVAPLRRTLAWVVGSLAAAVALSAFLGFPVPGRAAGIPWSSAGFVALFAGLVAVAAGGLLAGLAGAVPGRDALAQAGVRLAAGGGLVLVLAAGWLALEPGALSPQVPLVATLLCLARAAALSLLPALVAGVAVARAFDLRVRGGAVWTVIGAIALGAAVVHASCAATGLPHVLLGHIVEPVLAALVVGTLVAPLLRAKGARSR